MGLPKRKSGQGAVESVAPLGHNAPVSGAPRSSEILTIDRTGPDRRSDAPEPSPHRGDGGRSRRPPRKTARTLLRAGVLALIAAAVLVGLWRLRASHPRRNVLLVTLDTTRADRLSCYGYDRPTSPRLDAFAREATRFGFAIAQAANTPVSHASILTGLDPYHHGLRMLHGRAANRLPADRVTLAEVWRSAGARRRRS